MTLAPNLLIGAAIESLEAHPQTREVGHALEHLRRAKGWWECHAAIRRSLGVAPDTEMPPYLGDDVI